MSLSSNMSDVEATARIRHALATRSVRGAVTISCVRLRPGDTDLLRQIGLKDLHVENAVLTLEEACR